MSAALQGVSDKFTGVPADYPGWVIDVINLMRVMNGKIYNEIRLNRPDDDAEDWDEQYDTEEYKEREYTSLDQRRATASMIILKSLSPEISKDFKHMVNDVPGMWRAIRDKYHRQTEAAKTTLYTQYHKERLKEGETIDSYVSRLKDTIRRLQGYGAVVDTASQKFTLLNGLPTSSYEYIKDKLSNNPQDYTFDEMVQQIQDKYDSLIRQKEKGEDGSEEKSAARVAREERAAFVAAAGPFRGRGRGRGGIRHSPYGGRGGRGGGRGGYRGVSRGGHGRGGYSGRGGSGGVGGVGEKGSDTVVCFGCNQTGHIRSNCPERAVVGKCFVCGKTGHRAAQCRQAMGGGVRSFGDGHKSEKKTSE